MAIPKIKNITELKKEATALITEANQGQQIMVTHKSGDVFLVPRNEYEEYLELKDIEIAFSESEKEEGEDIDKVFAQLYKKYGYLDENSPIKTRNKRSR